MGIGPRRRNLRFETVLEAQKWAKRQLPRSVYSALVSGSEQGATPAENMSAFAQIQFAPRVAGHHADRDLSTTILGIPVAMPVMVAPTATQAILPEGEVAVARAAASRGLVSGLSSFASKGIEEVTAANENTFFQLYWTGSRETILQRMERAKAAGAKALIATPDWSFSVGRDWGTPSIPERLNLSAALKFAPEALMRPRWLAQWMRAGLPDLKAPNLLSLTGEVPTFYEGFGEWVVTPPPSWEDIEWIREQWNGKFMLKGVTRIDDARRAVDAGVDAISVSNHGGNNLDTTPATIRCLPGIVDAVGDQVEVLLDGGVRRGSDVAKALALGARAVMIGRAYLWGLGANGQAGVENVLDILRQGLDSAVLGLGHSSVSQLSREDFHIPQGFEVRLGDSSAGDQ
jgi:heme/flavin dehydrogenase (mycofactocin system)